MAGGDLLCRCGHAPRPPPGRPHPHPPPYALPSRQNDAAAYAVQHNPEQGLVPWGAHPDVLIDRYDVRSLLDIYVEPDPR